MARSTTLRSAANGCRFVPAEGFLLDMNAADIPPLVSCGTAGGMRARGARGSARGRRGHANTAAADKYVENAWGETKQAEMIRAVLGPGIEKRDLEQAFSGVTRDGVPARSKIESVYRSKKGVTKSLPDGVLDVTVKLSITIGKHEGFMKRRFFRDERRNDVWVEHMSFDLDESMPQEMGRGVAESVTRNALRWEKAIGLSRATTHASWVGRYVWATFGWMWDPDEARLKGDELVQYLEDHEPDFLYDGSSFLGPFNVPTLRDFKKHVVPALVRLPWNFASLHLRDRRSREMVHVARTFLVGIKSADGKHYVLGEQGAGEWDGMLVLRDGHPSYERARKRLGL